MLRSHFIFMPIIKDFLKKYLGIKEQKIVISQKPTEKLLPFSPNAAFDLPEYPSLSLTTQIEYYVSWIYIAVSRRAQDFSTIKLKLYRRKKNDFEEITEHPAIDLLDKANEFQTFYDLMEHYQTFIGLTGECFWWLVRNSGGDIISIYPWLRPDRMEVATSAKEFIKGYVYNIPGSGNKVPFDKKEILHFKYINPLNPYRGLSPIKAAEYAVTTNQETLKWNWRFFKNGAKPFGALKTEQTVTQEMYDRIRLQWETKYKGQENAHKIAVLGNGLEYQDIGFSQKDMDFMNLRKWSRDEILAAFKVPMALVDPNETVTYANAETAKVIYLEHTIVPEMRKFVSYLNEYLLSNYSEDLFFDFENPVPEMQEKKLTYYTAGIGNGWLTQNEIREKEQLDKVENGDTLYIPANFIPSASTSIKEEQLEEIEETEKEKKFMVRIKSRTDKEIMSETIQEEIKKSIGKMLEKKVKKINDKEKRYQMIWEGRQKIINKQTNVLKILLKNFFFRQWYDRVGKNFDAKQKIIFDIDLENRLLKNIVEPEIKKNLKKHFGDALRQVGSPSISDEVLQKYIDDNGEKFVRSVNETTLNQLNKTYEKGMENDLNLTEIKKELTDIYGDTIRNRTENIVRTETQRIANWSTDKAYKESGVVEAKEWFTAEDERTCEDCAELHEKIVSVEDTFYDKGDELESGVVIDYDDVGYPPLHPGCRCTLLPITIPIKKSIDKKI